MGGLLRKENLQAALHSRPKFVRTFQPQIIREPGAILIAVGVRVHVTGPSRTVGYILCFTRSTHYRQQTPEVQRP